jgi:hypothetical protein
VAVIRWARHGENVANLTGTFLAPDLRRRPCQPVSGHTRGRSGADGCSTPVMDAVGTLLSPVSLGQRLNWHRSARRRGSLSRCVLCPQQAGRSVTSG